MKEYFDRIHSGLPIDDVKIVDFHAHLGPYFNMHIPTNDSAGMVRLMDRCGIDKTIISSNPAFCADPVYGNNLMLEAVKTHRGRLYGACTVNGNYPDLSLDELHRCFEAERDVVLIKVHPFLSACKMTDPRMKCIYEYASVRKHFILAHTWLDNDPYGSLDIFEKVTGEYPDIKWLMGHSGGPFAGHRAVAIAKTLPNVFLDLTISFCPARQIEFFVKEVGSERILFGTDNPFIDPRPQIGRVFLADISHADMENIVGGNARRYIKF
jgi:uncharacterized protein